MNYTWSITSNNGDTCTDHTILEFFIINMIWYYQSKDHADKYRDFFYFLLRTLEETRCSNGFASCKKNKNWQLSPRFCRATYHGSCRGWWLPCFMKKETAFVFQIVLSAVSWLRADDHNALASEGLLATSIFLTKIETKPNELSIKQQQLIIRIME